MNRMVLVVLTATGLLMTGCMAPEPRDGLAGAGFTVNVGDVSRDVASFERQAQRVADEGGNWIRFGIPATQVVEEWGRGDQMRFDQEALQQFESALSFASDLGLRVYLVTTDSYNDDSDRAVYQEIMSGYWSELAERFAGSVDVWQVFNEPDAFDYVTAETYEPGDPEYFQRLADDLSLAREVIQDSNPDVRVTTNALGYPFDDARESSWYDMFDVISASVDIISVGVYPQTDEARISETTARLDRLSERYRKPVIVAEVGLHTCQTCFSEADASSAVAETVRAIDESSAVASIVYVLQDDGNTAETTFGLLRVDGVPKEGSADVFSAVRDFR